MNKAKEVEELNTVHQGQHSRGQDDVTQVLKEGKKKQGVDENKVDDRFGPVEINVDFNLGDSTPRLGKDPKESRRGIKKGSCY